VVGTYLEELCDDPGREGHILILVSCNDSGKKFRTQEAETQSQFKGSPVHVATVCARSGEGSDQFRSYVHSISLHFCKKLFQGLEPMTSWSQGNSFTTVLGLPFKQDHTLQKKNAPAHQYQITRNKNMDACKVFEVTDELKKY
jgi:hypothetical protein